MWIQQIQAYIVQVHVKTSTTTLSWVLSIKCKNAVDVTCVNNARHKKWKDDVKNKFTFISAQFSRSVMSDSLWPHETQHARPPCPSPTPGVYPNSCPLSRWCHLTISSSVIPFSSCLQSFPTSGSFQMSQLFTLGGENIGVSASTSVLPMNTQDWSIGWTGWISLQSKGLSRVFSNTTIHKHQFLAFFMVQLSYPYMTTGKIIALTIWTFVRKSCLCFLICCLGLS